MPEPIIVALISLGAIVLGGLVTYLFNRQKTHAEIEKLRAETEKTRLEYLHRGGWITKETFNRINDFYFFTTPILYDREVSDDLYLTVQYLVRELMAEMEQIYRRHVPEAFDE